MTRIRILALVAVLAAGWLAIADNLSDDAKFLQGSWSGSFVEFGGADPPDEYKNLRLSLTIAGELYQVFQNNQLLMTGTIKLDTTKSPKAVDTTYADGPLKGQTQRGIYEIRGDAFFTNFARPGNDRPKTLKTRPKSDEVLVRYERVKK